jgi:hypothetical protein
MGVGCGCWFVVLLVGCVIHSGRSDTPPQYPPTVKTRSAPGLCRSDGQQIVEIGGETGAFGRRMLRVPGLRSDWVGLR